MADALAGRSVCLVLATSAGGVGRHVRTLAATLVRAGARVTVSCPQSTEDTFDFAATGATYQRVEIASGPRPVQDLRALRALRQAAAGSDLVHAHGLRAGVLSGWAHGRSHRPLVVTWHNAVLASGVRRRVYEWLERSVARRATVTVCVSGDLVDRVRSIGGLDVRLAPVGASPPAASQRPVADVRAELAPADTDLVVAVGRLHPQKGFDTLIGAARILRGRARPVTVAIAGDGPQRAELTELVAASGAPVQLLGWRQDVADLHRAADVVVFSSTWEGSPLAAHEALFAGRPVVSTAVGGMPDLLAGDAGVLVPVGDAPALAAAVASVLDDPAAAARLAEGASRRAAEWPSAGESAERVLDLYRDLLERP